MRSFAVICVGIAVALCLTACQGNTAPAEGRLASSMDALLDQELSGELSDWDRAVLEQAREDGQISHADYVEGADLYETCMSDSGYAVERTVHLNGLIEFQPGAVPLDDAARDALLATNHTCLSSTYGRTQELYRFQRGNPELLTDVATVALRCLSEAGVVDDQFTRDDFQEHVVQQFDPDALPFDVMDAQVQTCLYTAGLVRWVDDE